MKKNRLLSLFLAVVMLFGSVCFALPELAFTATAAGTDEVTVTTNETRVMHYFKEDTYYTMPETIDTPLTYEFEVLIPGTIPVGDEENPVRGGVIFGNYGRDKTRCVNVELYNGSIRFYVNTANGKVADIKFSTDVRANKVQHIAITVDPTTGTVNLYQNGVLLEFKTDAKLVNLPDKGYFPYSFVIGGDAREGNTNYFKGAIVSAALYSDVRTAEEIAADVSNVKDWNASADHLVAAYDITKQGYAGLRDYSGNGNTLIPTYGEGMRMDLYALYSIDQQLQGMPETVEAWLWIPDYFPENKGDWNYDRVGTFLGNNGASKANPDIAFEIEYAGHPRFFYTTESGGTAIHEFGKVDVRTGKWEHVVIVHDVENGEARCYLNGALADTLAYTEYNSNHNGGKQYPVEAYSSNLNNDLYAFGADLQSIAYRQIFKGYIKELRVYGDVRSIEEIAADYAGTTDYTDENFLLHYQPDSSMMQGTVTDLTGNGHDAVYNQKLFEEHAPIEEYAYSLAVVGDTQTVTRHNPDKLKTIYQWIVDNKEAKNIQYVIGLGDITERGEDWGHKNNDTEAETANGDAEWAAAREAISLMDGELPYTLIRGAGHDGRERFNEWFGDHKGYTDNIAGYYKEGRIENVYHTFKVGNVDYMILCLDFGAKDDVLEWANALVAAHPTHRVIVTTHGYMEKDGSLLETGEAYCPSQSYYDKTNNDGDDLWNKFVRKHANICMVMCGHMSADDVVVSKQTGDHGNEVTQILVDPQSMDSSSVPLGMVAMLYFSEDGEDVQVEYYSTITDTWRPNSSFTVSYGSTEAVDYSTLAEGYLVAQNQESGLYTVIENDYFRFLGGALRYADATPGSTNIRFGYLFDESFDLSTSEWKWNYGIAGYGLTNEKVGTNASASNRTNLVITGVTSPYFAEFMEVQLTFTVTVDGVKYTVIDRVRRRSVLGVAESIVRDPNESAGAKSYAQSIVDAMSAG